MAQNSYKFWNRFPVFLVILLFAFSASPAKAEVYKCESAKGKIVYSDTPCHSSSTQTVTDIQANIDASQNKLQPSERKQSSVMRQLDDAVKSAIAEEDFVRANALATTREHREWIAAAKKDAAKNVATRKTEAELIAEMNSSDECIQAKFELEKVANSSFPDSDVLAAKTSLMRVSCGLADDTPPTYVHVSRYGPLFNPYHYYSYKGLGYLPHRPKPLQPPSHSPRPHGRPDTRNSNDGLSVRIRAGDK